MSEASVVDREYVSIGLRYQVTEGVGAPALSDMACVAVDFSAASVAEKSVCER